VIKPVKGHGIMSLQPQKANPARLHSLNHQHWGIDDGLHYWRDMTFDEGRCRIRKYAGAQVMASLRNLAISLLRLTGAGNIASALRACARNFPRPLRLLGLALTQGRPRHPPALRTYAPQAPTDGSSSLPAATMSSSTFAVTAAGIVDQPGGSRVCRLLSQFGFKDPLISQPYTRIISESPRPPDAR
jgi:hypothetical protein